jgi:hypothetical protein
MEKFYGDFYEFFQQSVVINYVNYFVKL